MTSLLTLVQLIDSSFPTGAFSHSFGLETALQEGRVTHGGELVEWVASHLAGSLAPMEGAAVLRAHRLAQNLMTGESAQDPSPRADEKLKRVDQRITLSKLARETREGGMKTGKRYLRTVIELYPESGLHRYEDWIRQGECFGSACVVHGWICAWLGHPPGLAVSSYLYAGANSLVQNALRAMMIGQTEGQKVLARLLPVVEEETTRLLSHPPPPEEWFSSALSQEIAGMRHETLYSRLFMS